MYSKLWHYNFAMFFTLTAPIFSGLRSTFVMLLDFFRSENLKCTKWGIPF